MDSELQNRISHVQLNDIKALQAQAAQQNHELASVMFAMITANVHSFDALDELAHMLWNHVETVRQNAKRSD